jgi:AraC-like DNA-binding protein
MPSADEVLPSRLLNRLQTELIELGRTTCSSSWAQRGTKEFRDSFGRIYWVERGGGDITQRGRLFELRPGHLFAIPAYTASCYRCDGDMVLLWLHYNAELLGGIEPFDFFNWDLVAGVEDEQRMSELWGRLLALWPPRDASGMLESDGILRHFLSCFAARRTGGDVRDEGGMARFESVFAYIDANLSRALSLGELAGVVHLHPTYFSNVFSRVVGMPPIQYVNQRRVKRAELLLLTTSLSVKEVAARTGFSDVFYFSRLFKRTTGFSPSAYRKREHRC